MPIKNKPKQTRSEFIPKGAKIPTGELLGNLQTGDQSNPPQLLHFCVSFELDRLEAADPAPRRGGADQFGRKPLETVEPIGKRVLIRKDEDKKQTKGGIQLPDNIEIPTITGPRQTGQTQSGYTTHYPESRKKRINSCQQPLYKIHLSLWQRQRKTLGIVQEISLICTILKT